jgi:enoyl-CoA hydratase/carnithine racemase
MPMIDLKREGDVFVLHINAGENRFTPDLVSAVNEALDRVEAAGSPAALVTTGAGKFYSNGLDLDWMMARGREEAEAYLASVLAIFARVLTFPAVTVAALNGHAFGAGGQIALAHDYRVMRTGRGYLCMPEIDMRAHLHPGMTALIQARLPAATSHEMIATGRRYTAEEALAAGIVDRAVAEDEVLPTAIRMAGELAPKAHPAMGGLKRDMYPSVLEALARTPELVARS